MRNRKIGILTFHGADNLGAVLQAYALTKYIESESQSNVEIIDYKCEKVEATRYPQSDTSIPKKLALVVYYWIKRKGFDSFRKEHLNLSDDEYDKTTIRNCISKYDTFIVGSDQVWNYDCSGGDNTYFLDFVPEFKKKYSYAASLGTYKFKENESNQLQALLSSFKGVSVREESNRIQMQYLGIKNAKVHPDPVFILSKEQWKSVMSKRLIKEKYVFVYLIQQDVNVLTHAKYYAKKNKCKIINNKKSLEFIIHNSPKDFLSWIYYADCVFTNSFHGTAFSLIFNKLLAADIELVNGGQNNRVKEVLISANSQQCILNKEDCKPQKGNSKRALEEMVDLAHNYLDEICN